jgi:NAD(P)-dependent dehydrogenase (short-subunit alcohol dehydrogenase family)
MSTNLRGVWLCTKYEIPEMLKTGGGAIVNNSSLAGLLGVPNMSASEASKHGVLGLTKTTALEFAQQGIRANAVCPGAIKTEMIDRIIQNNPAMLDSLNESHPIGRIGKPEEVAEAVIWLCSEKSSFVTGESLVVDGGYVIR